jgi:peptidoglycan/LPS O-acetylase OafA/YrhL
VLASLFYIPVPGPTGEINPILGVGWTINYEMFFYVVFSITLLLPMRVSRIALAAALIGLVLVGALVPGWHSPCSTGRARSCSNSWLVAVSRSSICAAYAFSVPVAAVLVLGAIGLMFASEAAGLGEGQGASLLCPGHSRHAGHHRAGVHHAIAGPRIRALHRLGDASYAMYLAHPFAINVAAIVWRKLHLGSIASFFALAVALPWRLRCWSSI